MTVSEYKGPVDAHHNIFHDTFEAAGDQAQDIDPSTFPRDHVTKRSSPPEFGPWYWTMFLFIIVRAGTFERDPRGFRILSHDSRGLMVSQIMTLMFNLPCSTCSKHIKELLCYFPLTNFDRDRNTALCWLWNIHNLVNLRTGKKTYAWIAFQRDWPLMVDGDDLWARTTPPFVLHLDLDSEDSRCVLDPRAMDAGIGPSKLLPVE